ncbi:MAG: hypothetical protein AAGB16_06065, partial [Pseudomonadota bacterium]
LFSGDQIGACFALFQEAFRLKRSHAAHSSCSNCLSMAFSLQLATLRQLNCSKVSWICRTMAS